MSFIVAAIAGTAIAGVGASYIAGKGAESAATATKDSTALATQETARQFDVVDENLAPYREIGTEFLPALKQYMRGDYRGFLESPDYKFTLEEGEKAIDRKASAAGSRFGGRALKEAVGYAEGLASTFSDKYFNKLFNVVGIGSSAAAGTAQAALQTGQTNASIYNNQGSNLASIANTRSTNQANALTSTVGNLTTLAAYNSLINKMPAG